jgi:acyl carrier protein
VVSELTGYPAEMLRLDMDIEADLGIDSIKRVEILSAVREQAPELPEFDMAEMGSLNTLGEIVEYMKTNVLGPQGGDGGSNGSAGGSTSSVSFAPEPDAPAADDAGVGRYALKMTPRAAPGLAPPWLLDGTAVHVTDDRGGVAPALVDALSRAGVNAILSADPPADARAVIALDGLRPVTNEDQAVDEAVAVNQEVFRLAARLAPGFSQEGGLFVTVQDTGGDFGLESDIGPRAWLGGLSGLAKTAAQEWPQAVVRALDVGRGDQSAEEVAERLAAELLNGGDALEIGLPADGRRISFDSVLREAQGGAPVVDSSSVIVVSGGARGVTAAALIELAKAAQPKLALLGRSTLEEESPALQAIQDDAGLKRALLAEARERGQTLTPLELGAAAHRIQASREIRATLQAMQAAGAEAIYLPCDVTDAGSLAQALETVRERWGPITGFVHGAGVLADKVLAEKTDEDFQRVFGTKVNGLRALLAATEGDPLNLICLFSSVAARTGNAGQADYAMANEVLNRVANAEARRRGTDNCVVKSIGWGPWAGGMVTPVLKAKFEELGVPLIPLDEGARRFVAELQEADRAEVEVVIGGLPTDGPLLSAPAPQGGSMQPVSYEVTVSAASHPELRSHVFNGTVVLPLVTVQDWFLRAANAWGGGDVEFGLCTNLRVRKGVPLPDFEDAPARFRIELQPEQLTPATLNAALLDDQGAVRFVAQLSEGSPMPDFAPAIPDGWETVDWSGADLYGEKLFHGPDFAALQTVERMGEDGAQATLTGSRSLNWREDHWAMDPALIDAGLQLARVWGVERLQQLTLPTTIREFNLIRPGLLEAGARVSCILRGETIGQAGTRSDLWFVDEESGETVAEIHGLEMYVSSEQPISKGTTADAL